MNLKRLSDVVGKEPVKNTKFKLNKTILVKVKKKNPDVSTFIQANQYNKDKQNLKKKIRDDYKKNLF